MTHLCLLLTTCAAVLAGVVLGCSTCACAIYFRQRRQLLASQIMNDLGRCEELYSRFIEQASETCLNAIEAPHEPGNLIVLSALVGRIRLASSRPVLDAAEGVMDFLLETCQRPADEVRDLIGKAPREIMAPLVAFTAACRAERERMLRGH
jgi:hypothetical protein